MLVFIGERVVHAQCGVWSNTRVQFIARSLTDKQNFPRRSEDVKRKRRTQRPAFKGRDPSNSARHSKVRTWRLFSSQIEFRTWEKARDGCFLADIFYTHIFCARSESYLRFLQRDHIYILDIPLTLWRKARTDWKRVHS